MRRRIHVICGIPDLIAHSLPYSLPALLRHALGNRYG
jgi:hypothetical protein